MSKPMKSQLLTLCLVAAASVAAAETNPPLYLDANQPIEKRIEDLLPRLTLQEKDSLVYANSTFSTAGVPRLGIPELWTDDGPMGVREEVGVGFRNMNRTDDFATAMPATLGLAATFNTTLARAYGGIARIGASALTAAAIACSTALLSASATRAATWPEYLSRTSRSVFGCAGL